MQPENTEEQPTPHVPRGRGPGRRWSKGTSGNPGGRPKVAGEIKDLARQHGREAIATLVRLMREGKREETRARASEALLDRGYGRPVQALAGEDGEALALRLQLEAGGADLLERLRALAIGAVLDPAASVDPSASACGTGEANGSGSRREPELTPEAPSASSLPAAPVSTMSPVDTPEAGQIGSTEGAAP